MTSGRRPRLRRDELRSLLLSAGGALLREQGLGTGAESLTFKRVFARVERDTGIRLTNASVIKRVWENQAAFQSEVLEAIATDEGAYESVATLGAAEGLLGRVDRSTPARRLDALRELIRVVGAANVEALRESPNWPTFIGVWALCTATAFPARDRIHAALRRGYGLVTDRYEEGFAVMLAFLGLRTRAGLTVRQFTVAAGALAEGYSLRDRVDHGELAEVRLPTGQDGTPVPWTLFSIAMEGLAEQYFELDPTWEPHPADGGDR